MKKYRTHYSKVSAALEEQESKISKLQRNYDRVVGDLEEKEALYTERIKALESERDGLRKWEHRSQHLAIEIEELRRKADAKRASSPGPSKTDDGMRSEIRRESWGRWG